MQRRVPEHIFLMLATVFCISGVEGSTKSYAYPDDESLWFDARYYSTLTLTGVPRDGLLFRRFGSTMKINFRDNPDLHSIEIRNSIQDGTLTTHFWKIIFSDTDEFMDLRKDLVWETIEPDLRGTTQNDKFIFNYGQKLTIYDVHNVETSANDEIWIHGTSFEDVYYNRRNKALSLYFHSTELSWIEIDSFFEDNFGTLPQYLEVRWVFFEGSEHFIDLSKQLTLETKESNLYGTTQNDRFVYNYGTQLTIHDFHTRATSSEDIVVIPGTSYEDVYLSTANGYRNERNLYIYFKSTSASWIIIHDFFQDDARTMPEYYEIRWILFENSDKFIDLSEPLTLETKGDKLYGTAQSDTFIYNYGETLTVYDYHTLATSRDDRILIRGASYEDVYFYSYHSGYDTKNLYLFFRSSTLYWIKIADFFLNDSRELPEFMEIRWIIFEDSGKFIDLTEPLRIESNGTNLYGTAQNDIFVYHYGQNLSIQESYNQPSSPEDKILIRGASFEDVYLSRAENNRNRSLYINFKSAPGINQVIIPNFFDSDNRTPQILSIRWLIFEDSDKFIDLSERIQFETTESNITLYGTSQSDTFKYNHCQGFEIKDFPNEQKSKEDRILLSGVGPSEVTVYRPSDNKTDLMVEIEGNGCYIRIDSFFPSTTATEPYIFPPVETIEFESDPTVWVLKDIWNRMPQADSPSEIQDEVLFEYGQTLILRSALQKSIRVRGSDPADLYLNRSGYGSTSPSYASLFVFFYSGSAGGRIEIKDFFTTDARYTRNASTITQELIIEAGDSEVIIDLYDELELDSLGVNLYGTSYSDTFRFAHGSRKVIREIVNAQSSQNDKILLRNVSKEDVYLKKSLSGVTSESYLSLYVYFRDVNPEDSWIEIRNFFRDDSGLKLPLAPTIERIEFEGGDDYIDLLAPLTFETMTGILYPTRRVDTFIYDYGTDVVIMNSRNDVLTERDRIIIRGVSKSDVLLSRSEAGSSSIGVLSLYVRFRSSSSHWLEIRNFFKNQKYERAVGGIQEIIFEKDGSVLSLDGALTLHPKNSRIVGTAESDNFLYYLGQKITISELPNSSDSSDDRITIKGSVHPSDVYFFINDASQTLDLQVRFYSDPESTITVENYFFDKDLRQPQENRLVEKLVFENESEMLDLSKPLRLYSPTSFSEILGTSVADVFMFFRHHGPKIIQDPEISIGDIIKVGQGIDPDHIFYFVHDDGDVTLVLDAEALSHHNRLRIPSQMRSHSIQGVFFEDWPFNYVNLNLIPVMTAGWYIPDVLVTTDYSEDVDGDEEDLLWTPRVLEELLLIEEIKTEESEIESESESETISNEIGGESHVQEESEQGKTVPETGEESHFKEESVSVGVNDAKELEEIVETLPVQEILARVDNLINNSLNHASPDDSEAIIDSLSAVLDSAVDKAVGSTELGSVANSLGALSGASGRLTSTAITRTISSASKLLGKADILEYSIPTAGIHGAVLGTLSNSIVATKIRTIGNAQTTNFAQIDESVSTITKQLRERMSSVKATFDTDQIQVTVEVRQAEDSLREICFQDDDCVRFPASIDEKLMSFCPDGRVFAETIHSNYNTYGSSQDDIESKKLDMTIYCSEPDGEIPITGLRDSITFSPLTPALVGSNIFHECVFWEPEAQRWSSEGCQTQLMDDQWTCSCNHLTTFSLRSVERTVVPTDDEEESESDDTKTLSSLASLFVVVLMAAGAFFGYKRWCSNKKTGYKLTPVESIASSGAATC